MPSEKKRKRTEDDDGNSTAPKLKISTTQPAPNQVTPALACFPSLEPPASTPYTAYVQNPDKTPLIAGETDAVEFFTNPEETNLASSSGCRYIIAAHNRRTNTTTLYPTPAPLHVLSRQVKAHKSLPASTVVPFDGYKEARTALGQTFGTKKALAAIRAEERNRVDVSAMEGVAGYLQQGIEDRTGELPTKEQAKESQDASRLIPPFSPTATEPADIYPLHDVIPESEWKSLGPMVSVILSANDENERLAVFPERRLTWLKNRLRAVFSTGKEPSKKALRILYYISTLLTFRRLTTFTRGAIDKNVIQQKMQGVPPIIVEGLTTRFLESTRDQNEYRLTPAKETLTLTYSFALCLRADGYATNTAILAKDLSMAPDKINNLFKSLGCTIAKLKEPERLKLGVPDDAADAKHAVLKAPLKFPNVGRGRKGR